LPIRFSYVNIITNCSFKKHCDDAGSRSAFLLLKSCKGLVEKGFWSLWTRPFIYGKIGRLRENNLLVSIEKSNEERGDGGCGKENPRSG
jgi:hypothetical protein